MKNCALLLVVFVLSFSIFPAVFAQIPSSAEGLDLSVSSNNPVPGQKVTITAKSYTIDINTARINWLIAGSSVQNGIGKTTLDTVAPALGKKTTINVVATTPDGLSLSGVVIIGSGYVDLITETDGYVPQFFKGKLSPVFQNTVTVIAMPHIADAKGVEYDPKVLTYQWKRNDQAIEDLSGYGKQSISLPGSVIPRDFDLSVTVWPRDVSSQAMGITHISVNRPIISFYNDDPLYGPLLNKAVSSIIRIGSQKETSILAIPFGFNKTADDMKNMTWSWLINGVGHPELSSKESVVLRAPESSQGSSDIQLQIINTDKILQGAKSAFSAQFNTTAAASAQSEAVSF